MSEGQRSRSAVSLVGLGNIGFRHLQGLAGIAAEIDVTGYDPNPAAVAQASDFWDGLPDSKGEFRAATTFAPAPVCILATPAAGRLDLINRIVTEAPPSVFLLEKVVFDRRPDFEVARQLLGDLNIRAYVNCPRRIWPVYQYLKRQVAKSKPVAMNVAGRGIGLACNTIHYLDLLQFLTGEQVVRVDASDLSAPWESKRPGYYEAWGTLKFSTPRGDTLQVQVLPDQENDAVMSVTQDGREWSLREPVGTLVTAEGEEQSFGRPPYQSELSGVVVSRLLRHANACEAALSSFEESAAAHMALFDSLARAFGEAGLLADDRLPIT